MNILKWILIASAILVFFAGTTGYIFILIKTSKLKKNYNQLQETSYKKVQANENKEALNKVVSRSTHGELLWKFLASEKKNNVVLLEPELIELSINTIIRNNYKTCLVWNDKNGFTGINIADKTEAKVFFTGASSKNAITINSKKYKTSLFIMDKTIKYDYIIIQGDKSDLNTAFDFSYKLLSKNGLILIDKIDSKIKEEKREIKDLLGFLRISGHRYEVKKTLRKYMLVAK